MKSCKRTVIDLNYSMITSDDKKSGVGHYEMLFSSADRRALVKFKLCGIHGNQLVQIHKTTGLMLILVRALAAVTSPHYYGNPQWAEKYG
jgi:hypothetical protein